MCVFRLAVLRGPDSTDDGGGPRLERRQPMLVPSVPYTAWGIVRGTLGLYRPGAWTSASCRAVRCARNTYLLTVCPSRPSRRAGSGCGSRVPWRGSRFLRCVRHAGLEDALEGVGQLGGVGTHVALAHVESGRDAVRLLRRAREGMGMGMGRGRASRATFRRGRGTAVDRVGRGKRRKGSGTKGGKGSKGQARRALPTAR